MFSVEGLGLGYKLHVFEFGWPKVLLGSWVVLVGQTLNP